MGQDITMEVGCWGKEKKEVTENEEVDALTNERKWSPSHIDYKNTQDYRIPLAQKEWTNQPHSWFSNASDIPLQR